MASVNQESKQAVEADAISRLIPPPHRTPSEYATQLGFKGIWYYLAYPKLAYDWRNGGQHYNWVDRVSPTACRSVSGLLRGDGKVMSSLSLGTWRPCTARDRTAEIVSGPDGTSHIKGVVSHQYLF